MGHFELPTRRDVSISPPLRVGGVVTCGPLSVGEKMLAKTVAADAKWVAGGSSLRAVLAPEARDRSGLNPTTSALQNPFPRARSSAKRISAETKISIRRMRAVFAELAPKNN
jgi:hypothetical protein